VYLLAYISPSYKELSEILELDEYEYEVEGARPRGRPKSTWRVVVQKDCQVRKLDKEDAMDRSRWGKLIMDS